MRLPDDDIERRERARPGFLIQLVTARGSFLLLAAKPTRGTSVPEAETAKREGDSTGREEQRHA